jgi:hypothetical protein
MPDLFTLSFLALVLGLIVLARIGLRSVPSSTTGNVLGSLVQFVLGFGTLLLVSYGVMYFLGLVGGFYESLTCKVVTLPACEDPLALPTWLRLPEQSVGGVIGILPLLGIFLAKVLQPKTKPLEPLEDTSWRVRFLRQTGYWFTSNAGLVFVFVIELWLAFLRGSAEAADRQVRIALGLDQDLPSAYLAVAQWGAVVLALGLSIVVVYLGIVGQYARLLIASSLAGLEYGAALVKPLVDLIHIIARGFVDLWKAVAISLGRLLLKLQSGLYRVWVLSVTALGRLLLKLQSILYRLWLIGVTSLGRFLLKTQSFLYRSWIFIATTIGWLLIGFRNLFRRRRRTLESLVIVALVSSWTYSHATTYVVLFDATGSEQGRLEETSQQVLSWADPSPERALLARGDRLVIIPIRAPGNLDQTYSSVFNATYPSSQLDRYAFFTELRDALPNVADSDDGTGLSDSLRAARTYLEDAEDEKILIVFGNGEDHSATPITASELENALASATVVHLNLGLEGRERWETLYREAGASRLLLYDLAATRSLRALELKEVLQHPSD